MTMNTFTCDCSACSGLSITAPAGYMAGTPAQIRAMVHTYAQYAHGSSPLGATLTARAGVEAVR